MNNFKPVLVLVGIAILGVSFQKSDYPEPIHPNDLLQLPILDKSLCKTNGKTLNAERFVDTFQPSDWKKLGVPTISKEMVKALKLQKKALMDGPFRDGRKLGNLSPTIAEFEQVIDLLLQRANSRPSDLHEHLDAHRVWGADKRGNVQFTGYYTPVMKVKKTKTKKYCYPLYAYPDEWVGQMPSRAEIEKEGVLDGLGLELAYVSDPIDISIMQLQGSGYVEYLDSGKRNLFRYAGHNGHRYRNIQHFFRNRKDLKIGDVTFNGIKRYINSNPGLRDSVLFFNPLYTFFDSDRGEVKGAGQVPLMKAISIAADPDYFPIGSVLLASYPIVKNGIVKHHEYRILLPQDVGGAITGPGHIDIYCGVGNAGEKMASQLHHYGKLWMLTPKRNQQVAEAM